MNDELDAAIDFAHARMADAGNDLSQLPIEIQTVIRIETMQGIIDNGGLQYFYENDFPDNPPYSQFVDDLLRLNAIDQAKQMQISINCLGFSDPHFDRERRNQKLAELWEKQNAEFIHADNQLCGNEDIWVKLEEYVSQNNVVFDTNW